MRILDALREREKATPPWMYACYRLGHFVDENGLCYCCLRVFPVDEEADDDDG